MQNQYATGKNVYSGGLPNAHSGTLDPSGYINRESKRRSGLAAVALARRDSGTKQQGAGPNPTKKSFNLSGMFISPIGKLGRLK